MPTRRKGFYSRFNSRARTRINRLSLALIIEFQYTPKPEQLSRVPRGRLLVIKHWQLAHQVGAFGNFATESSMDLDNMIFPVGSIFIFRSWIYKANGNGKLQSCLLEDSGTHEAHNGSTTTNLLAEKFSILVIPSSSPLGLRNVASTFQGLSSRLFKDPHTKLSTFSSRFPNTATSYQALLRVLADSVQMVRLTGAQEELVLTVTS
jgi:hypothetical protein